MQIKVSVIVPVYNVEQYLYRCLDSICNQTLKDIEILVIDDGSTDSSFSIIQEFAEKDERIRYYSQENQGQGIARNWGIENARGEFIGFVDSDDYVKLEMYEVLYNKAIENDGDIVECIRVETDPIRAKRIEEVVDGGINAIKLFSENVFKVAFWDKLFKRDLFIEHNIRFPLYPLKMRHQDFAISMQPLFFAKRIVLLNKEFYFYSDQRVGSVTNSITKKHLVDFEVALDINKKFLEKQGVFENLYNSYSKIYFNHSLFRFNNILKMYSSKKELKEMYLFWQFNFGDSEYFIRGKCLGQIGIGNRILLMFAKKYPYNWFICAILKKFMGAFKF